MKEALRVGGNRRFTHVSLAEAIPCDVVTLAYKNKGIKSE